MCYEAQLASICLFKPTIIGVGMILTHKVGLTDLVFGMRSGFISSFVQQDEKSVYSGYDLCHPD